MRAVGELASGVAHDLNNVLHAMALRLQSMRRQVRTGDALGGGVWALTRMVEDAASRGSARLQDLAYRRHDAPVGDVELATVVREAVEAARPELEHRDSRGAPVTVETELPAMPPVRGCAPELRDLFLSLLLNARDAMPDGGAVRVTAEVRGGRALVRPSPTRGTASHRRCCPASSTRSSRRRATAAPASASPSRAR